MLSKVGIKKDLVAKAGIPINPPLPIEKPTAYFKSHVFPIATLESVTFVPDQKSEDRQTGEITEQPVLKFTYKDTVNPEKKITDTIYPLDEDDEKFDMKLDGMQKSIKHVFEELIGADKFNEEDFGAEGTTSHEVFGSLFKNAADAFNKFVTTKIVKKGENGEEDTKKSIPSYTLVPFYLKLTYFNGRLSPTMFPNFVQRAYQVKGNQTVQVACELAIGKKDAIVNKADAKPASAGGARDAGFGATGAFGMDMSAADDMVFPE